MAAATATPRHARPLAVGLNCALGADLMRAYLDQVFVHGLIHADPHPGNVFGTGKNVPLIAASADRLYVETLGCQTRAVLAYDERLSLFAKLGELQPRFLLESVEGGERLGGFERYRDVDGDGIPYRTIPGDGMPHAKPRAAADRPVRCRAAVGARHRGRG